MVAYIASPSPLPLIPWRQDEPGFNVTELTEHERPVLQHLGLPYVCQAGSHTSWADALESSSRLARYVREHRVEQIYSCWSGDESQPKEFERHIKPGDLVAPDFFFRERELLFINDDAG